MYQVSYTKYIKIKQKLKMSVQNMNYLYFKEKEYKTNLLGVLSKTSGQKQMNRQAHSEVNYFEMF